MSDTTLTEVRQEPAAQPGADGHRTDRAVAWQLARVEGRRLVRHPLVWLGFALSGAFLGVNAGTYVPVVHQRATVLAMYVIPLVVAVLIVAFLAASRARRHGTEEVFDPAAARPGARTSGLLLSALWALGVAVIWTAAALALLYARGGFGVPAAGDVAQPMLLVWLGAVVGIAVGTWVPRPILLLVALAAIAGIQITLTGGQGGPEHTLAPLLQGNDWLLPEFTVRPVGWHSWYLVGLVGLTAALALTRHGMTSRRLLAAGAATSLVVSTGIVQVAAKPSSEHVGALVRMAQDPSQIERCDDRGTVLRTCTLPAYAPLGSRWAGPVAAVLDVAGPLARRLDGGMRIEQRVDVWDVLASVRHWYGWDAANVLEQRYAGTTSHLPDPDEASDPALRMHATWRPGHDELALGLELARRVAGIPTAEVSTYTWTEQDLVVLEEHGLWSPTTGAAVGVPEPIPGETAPVVRGCWLAGQAREVVAMWLAAAADPTHAQRLEQLIAENPLYHVVVEDGVVVQWGARSQWGLATGDGLLHWSKVGSNLARQLVQIPNVLERLVADWDHWTDPATSTDELIVAFGLEPLPTWEQFAADHGIDLDHPQMAHAPEMDPYVPEAFGHEHGQLPPPVQYGDPSSCGGPPIVSGDPVLPSASAGE